jgi:quinol-cytochrome oxidoreductase complex cytochrome b subunit
MPFFHFNIVFSLISVSALILLGLLDTSFTKRNKSALYKRLFNTLAAIAVISIITTSVTGFTYQAKQQTALVLPIKKP